MLFFDICKFICKIKEKTQGTERKNAVLAETTTSLTEMAKRYDY